MLVAYTEVGFPTPPHAVFSSTWIVISIVVRTHTIVVILLWTVACSTNRKRSCISRSRRSFSSRTYHYCPTCHLVIIFMSTNPKIFLLEAPRWPSFLIFFTFDIFVKVHPQASSREKRLHDLPYEFEVEMNWFSTLTKIAFQRCHQKTRLWQLVKNCGECLACNSTLIFACIPKTFSS